MSNRYLLDTNPIIDFLNGRLSNVSKELILANEPIISVITHIELLSTKNVPWQEWEYLIEFVRISTVLNLDDETVNQTILLRQNHKLKTPDAIIAATAMVNNLNLVTRNISDFQNIPELHLINPYVLQ